MNSKYFYLIIIFYDCIFFSSIPRIVFPNSFYLQCFFLCSHVQGNLLIFPKTFFRRKHSSRFWLISILRNLQWVWTGLLTHYIIPWMNMWIIFSLFITLQKRITKTACLFIRCTRNYLVRFTRKWLMSWVKNKEKRKGNKCFFQSRLKISQVFFIPSFTGINSIPKVFFIFSFE